MHRLHNEPARAWLAAGASLALLIAAAASPVVAAEKVSRAELDRMIAAADTISLDIDGAKAEAAWARAAAAAEASLPPSDPRLGMVITKHAAGLQAVNRFPEAEKEAERGLAILSADPKAPRDWLVQALYGKGALAASLGRNDVAEASLRQALDVQAKAHPEPTPVEADVRFELAVLLNQRGHVPDAIEQHQKALAIRESLLKPGAPELVMSKMAYGNLLQNNGRLQEAEALERAAVDDALKYLPPEHPTAILAMQSLASLLKDEGRTDEAAAVQKRAVDRANAANPVSDLTGQALGLLGFIQIEQGRFADAEASFRTAADILVKVHGHDSRVVAFTLANLGTAQRLQEHNQAAAESYEACLAILKRMGNVDPFLSALAANSYAGVLDGLGRREDALAQAKSASDWMAANLPDGDPRRVQAEVGLAWMELRTGRTEAGARGLAAQADLVMADVAARTLAPSQSNIRRLKGNIDHVMVGLYESGDMERGFRLAQLSMETEAGRAAAALNARLQAGSESLADLLRRRQTLAAEREKANAAYLTAVGKDPASAPALAERLKQADQALADFDARLARDVPNHQVLVAPQTVTIADAQARLRPDEALVAPVLADGDLITIALTRTTAVWDRTPRETADVRLLVGRVRAGLDQRGATRAAVDASGGVTAPAAPAYDRQAAYQLYRAIFTPKIAAAVASARELSISTGPMLSTLPFSALVTAEPKGDDRDPRALRKTAWLVRSKAVQAAPAVRAIRAETPQPEAGGGFFGAGAPSLSGQAPVKGAAAYFRDGATDLASLKSLPPLPAAEGELKAMAVALGGADAKVLTGGGATERAVKAADLSHAKVVAFATHGLVGGDIGGLSEPGLVFTPPDAPSAEDDGVLTASEAASLKLNADWVVLSACNTAAGERPDAPGYTGLARAFIFAGGKRVLASHWPVRDDAAARLTVETVKGAARGESPARALQKAELRLIDDPRTPGGSDPSVWAPFELIGR